MAEFRAALTPPLTASAPPVKKPAMTVQFDTLAQVGEAVFIEVVSVLAL